MNTQSTLIRNHTFVFHASGALFWSEKSMLLISDVHLGKVSHFRKYGAAVPQNAIARNFELMDEAINFFKPEQLVFMGDLFHSSLNNEWKFFEHWMATVISKVTLVAGNHDIISSLKYENLGIEVVSEMVFDDFLLTHHPEDRKGFFNFSGHIHPAIRLRGTGRQSLRLPCFFKSTNQMVLPAFGAFTGSHVLEPKNDNEVYAISEDAVFKIELNKGGGKHRS
ncbi:ligase-associated DNA damage response endonuclease PdeM [uncultured Kriegella sp.]|uniref:ligase-associated DNA damage response endonuclease PdeM n=1 Tax=uncultured Kriegella sp. TaxID=1798910 RepID=UPI0030D86D16|tara:strand:+ start:32703 stop:33371 length:669 start_codon:yes stop_codon:yes gene_type:complete